MSFNLVLCISIGGWIDEAMPERDGEEAAIPNSTLYGRFSVSY